MSCGASTLFSIVQQLFLLLCLFGGFRYFASGRIFEINRFNDTNGDRLSHVTYGKSTEWRKFLETFNAQRFGWHQNNDGRITGLNCFRILFGSFARTTVAFLFDLRKFARNVGRMTIQHGRIPVGNLSGMIEYNDL